METGRRRTLKSEKAVKDLKRYLDKNYHKAIRIGALCAGRYVSEQYICRRFKEIVGASPKQYLMQLRLNRAAERLAQTNEPVYQAAFACGFTDINNFCKQFRAAFGCTPGQYRDNQKQRADGQ